MSVTPRNSNKTRQQQLFDNFVDILVEMTEPDPETGQRDLGAPMASVIRQFIKDQNISADEEKHQGLKRLAEQGRSLPFTETPNEGDI